MKTSDEADIWIFNSYLNEKNGAAIENLYNGEPEKELYWWDIQKSFAPKRRIGKHNEMIRIWREEAIGYVVAASVSIQENRDKEYLVMEVYNEMNEHELKLFWRNLSPETKIDIENILHLFTTAA